MLVVRQAQLDAFKALKRDQFVRETAKHLRTHFAEEVGHMDGEALERFVRDGIARAARHDVTSERDGARFIDLMVAIRPDFDALPAVQAVRDYLTYPGVTGTNRVDKFYDMVRAGRFDRELEESWM